MAEYGFAQPAEGGSYRPGPRLLGLAAAALDAGRDLRLARPVLADLRRRTGLLAYYAVRDAGDAVFLELSEPAREYRMSTRPGGRAPLHHTAAGLAMLSALPAEEVSDVLAGAAPPRTPGAGALAEPQDVRAELAATVRRGYALDDEYEEEDARAVAAPVLDADGRAVGAIAVRGLTFALDDAAVELFGPMVRAAARTVSAGLGGPPRLGVVPAGRDGGRA